MGIKWESNSAKEVTERWEELDKKRGNEFAMMTAAHRMLKEVGDELDLHPKGQLLTPDIFTDMLNGDFTPNWSVNEALPNDYHKGTLAFRFAQYTPKEIQAEKDDREVREESKANRRLDEAKEIQNKKPKAPPRSYDAVVNMLTGACRFYATWTGIDSNITEDYLACIALMADMINTESEVPTNAWLSVVWLAIDNDRQYFSTRVGKRELSRRRGLPRSNLVEEEAPAPIQKPAPGRGCT